MVVNVVSVDKSFVETTPYESSEVEQAEINTKTNNIVNLFFIL